MQYTLDGIREIAGFACVSVNLYCVSYQLNELVHTTTVDKGRPDKKSLEELRVVEMNPLDDFLESVISSEKEGF